VYAELWFDQLALKYQGRDGTSSVGWGLCPATDK